jgi:ankyrin repeat protein
VGSGVDVCVRELVTRGADLNVPDKDGCTAFHLCARYGQPEYLELLVSSGVGVNSVSKGGLTALHWSALRGAVTCLVKLLALGNILGGRS